MSSSTLPPPPCSSSLPHSGHSLSSSITSFYSAHSYLSTSSSTSSISPRESPEPSPYPSTRSSSRVSSNDVSKMYQVANLDDTAGFMAAARALTQKGQLSKDKDVSGDAKAKSDSKSPRRPLSPCAPEFVPSSSSSSLSPMKNLNPNAEEFVPVEENHVEENIGKLSSLIYWLRANVFVVDSAQDAAQEVGLDAGLSEFAKNNVPSNPNMTVDVNETVGFMAAARARFHTYAPEHTVTASSKNSKFALIAGLGLANMLPFSQLCPGYWPG